MYNIDDIRNTIIHGNALETLRNIPDESVNCVVTSPPYWGLRFYGEETKTIWDGNPDCEHEWGEEIITARHKKGETNPGKEKWYKDNDAITPIAGNFCLKCGAWYGQLGLEPALDMFINHLLQITVELKRVLKKTGTLWWNMGDNYKSSGGPSRHWGYSDPKYPNGRDINYIEPSSLPQGNIQPKSLCLQNFRLVQRMIDEQGWILRNILIWHKLNSTPSSVKDRFTVDFEPVFFFVKSKKYYFEQQFEPFQESTYQRINYAFNPSKGDIQGAVKSSGQRKFAEHLKQGLLNGRNKRCVWTINTQPFKDAHFAVMPEKLVEPMIRAGCPKEICKKCGKINACNCNVGFKPGIVLDPFMGAGTVAVVAKKLGRDYVGIELNPEYIKIAEKRIAGTLVNETLFDTEVIYEQRF